MWEHSIVKSKLDNKEIGIIPIMSKVLFLKIKNVPSLVFPLNMNISASAFIWPSGILFSPINFY